LFLGLGLGTSGVKALLLDANGCIGLPLNPAPRIMREPTLAMARPAGRTVAGHFYFKLLGSPKGSDMLKNLVKMAVPNPGSVAVGSTITLGAAPTGYQSFLAAFGAGVSAFFMLSDGAGRNLGGVWTVNSSTPATATITGPLTLSTAPTTTQHAATKGYVDTGDAARLPLTGGTLTGALTV
jgi:hypothetical protein